MPISKMSPSDHLALKEELAAACQKVGDARGFPAQASLGRVNDAVASYRKAQVLWEEVAAGRPDKHLNLSRFYQGLDGKAANALEEIFRTLVST